ARDGSFAFKNTAFAAYPGLRLRAEPVATPTRLPPPSPQGGGRFVGRRRPIVPSPLRGGRPAGQGGGSHKHRGCVCSAPTVPDWSQALYGLAAPAPIAPLSPAPQ